MSPLNHKKTTSSLAPPIFYNEKIGNKEIEGSPFNMFVFITHRMKFKKTSDF